MNLQQIKLAVQERENKNYINYVCDDVLINELIDVANEYDLDYTDIFDNVITLEEVEDMALNELKSGGVHRLKYFLGSIIDTPMDNEYYIIDGYGNIDEIRLLDIKIWIEEIEKQIKDNE